MKKILLSIPILLAGIGANAQSIGPSTLNSAGGSAVVGSNTFEYSIGEMTVVSTNTAGTITITHGVLQPNAAKAEGIDDILLLDKSLNIYPNPTSNDVNIAVSVNNLKIESVQLYDASGKLIFSNSSPILKNNIYSFSMNTFAVGNYVLKINSNKNNTNHTSTFTITKSN